MYQYDYVNILHNQEIEESYKKSNYIKIKKIASKNTGG